MRGGDVDAVLGAAEALADLDLKATVDQVRAGLDSGGEPRAILEQCRRGLTIAGQRYARAEYFLSELLLAAEIFKQVLRLLEPKLEEGALAAGTVGKLMIATVKGDIHDLGKNIVVLLARGGGFQVYDLGVDVSVQALVDAAREVQPDIVGLSVLLSTGFPAARETVQAIRQADLSPWPKIIVGGGVVTEEVRAYTGADAWADDVVRGLDLCKAWCGV